jgi:hypothetical protein
LLPHQTGLCNGSGFWDAACDSGCNVEVPGADRRFYSEAFALFLAAFSNLSYDATHYVVHTSNFEQLTTHTRLHFHLHAMRALYSVAVVSSSLDFIGPLIELYKA